MEKPKRSKAFTASNAKVNYKTKNKTNLKEKSLWIPLKHSMPTKSIQGRISDSQAMDLGRKNQ